VKIKLSILAILILIAFSGCSQKEPLNIVKVKGTCQTPNVNCDFRGETIDQILGKYLECIIDLKKANEVCK